MTERRRCYYEVLDVDRKSTFDEIRSAYKKKSLIYHPDKNYGNQEEAAIKFKEVQNAYSILSNTEERAWYDSHRESILRGDNGEGCDPDDLNLYEYFTSSCYEGFGDDEGGFFSVYRKVFETLVEEESDYSNSAKSWPAFGNSESSWAETQRFYGHWKNFSTEKNFAWKDEYKANEMEDRYSRRTAERINQKARSGAKKEYVQTVQNLANFVYRRDPRVKAELERQEAEESARQLDQERKNAERQKRRHEANKRIWAEAAEREAREDAERLSRGEALDGTTIDLLYEKDRQAKESLKAGGCGNMSGFAMLEGDNDDKQSTVFSCAACKKQFKSTNQYTEHVNSNKHKTKLKQLIAKGVDVAALMGEKADASE